MATELDQMMDEAIQALTGEGGMLPLTTFEKYGQKLPMIASAPPALSHFFAYFCMQHADAEFLPHGRQCEFGHGTLFHETNNGRIDHQHHCCGEQCCN